MENLNDNNLNTCEHLDDDTHIIKLNNLPAYLNDCKNCNEEKKNCPSCNNNFCVLHDGFNEQNLQFFVCTICMMKAEVACLNCFSKKEIKFYCCDHYKLIHNSESVNKCYEKICLRHNLNLEEIFGLLTKNEYLLRKNKFNQLINYLETTKKNYVIIRGASGSGKTIFGSKIIPFLLNQEKHVEKENISFYNCLSNNQTQLISDKVESIKNDKMTNFIIVDEVQGLSEDDYIKLVVIIKTSKENNHNIVYILFGIYDQRDGLSSIENSVKEYDFLKFDKQEFKSIVNIFCEKNFIGDEYQDKLNGLKTILKKDECIEHLYEELNGNPCLTIGTLKYLMKIYIQSQDNINGYKWVVDNILSTNDSYLTFIAGEVKTFKFLNQQKIKDISDNVETYGPILINILSNQNFYKTSSTDVLHKFLFLESKGLLCRLEYDNKNVFCFSSKIFGFAIISFLYKTRPSQTLINKILCTDDKFQIVKKVCRQMIIDKDINKLQSQYLIKKAQKMLLSESSWVSAFAQALCLLLSYEGNALHYNVSKEVAADESFIGYPDLFLNSFYNIVFEICSDEKTARSHVLRKYKSELETSLKEYKISSKEIRSNYKFKSDIKYLVVNFSRKPYSLKFQKKNYKIYKSSKRNQEEGDDEEEVDEEEVEEVVVEDGHTDQNSTKIINDIRNDYINVVYNLDIENEVILEIYDSLGNYIKY